MNKTVEVDIAINTGYPAMLSILPDVILAMTLQRRGVIVIAGNEKVVLVEPRRKVVIIEIILAVYYRSLAIMLFHQVDKYLETVLYLTLVPAAHTLLLYIYHRNEILLPLLNCLLEILELPVGRELSRHIMI